MQRFEIDKEITFYKLAEVISTSDVDSILLVFEKGSILVDSALDLKVLKEIALKKNKKITFESKDTSLNDFLKSINEDRIEFSIPEINIDVADKKSLKLPGFGFSNPLSKNKNRTEETVDENEKAQDDQMHQTYKVSSGFSLKKAKPAIIILFALFAIFSIGYAAFWFVPSATVKITLKTDTLIKLLDVKAVKGASLNVESKTISAVEINVSEEESQTIKTTGKKIDGTKAKGKIRLVNKQTDKDVKIKKKTILKLIDTDKENIRYITTEEVTVPKATETAPDPKVNGEKEVSVEALEFGDDYNLDSDEKFEIEDYDTDDLIGQNDSKISGGKKEEKNVVAQIDLDSLKSTVEDLVKKKVTDSMKKKTISSQVMIENSIKYETVDVTYSKKLDEEAEELTMTVTMSGVGLAYSKDDLDQIVKELAKTVVPEKYNLDGDNVTYEVASTLDPSSTSSVNIQIKLRTSIFPKLDVEVTKRDMAGMTLPDAQNYLSKISNISEYEITVVPQMPSFMMRLPVNAGNIRVKIEK